MSLTKATTPINTAFGSGQLTAYQFPEGEYLALLFGTITSPHRILTRVHDACVTADVFHSDRCDCRQQRIASLQQLALQGQGIFIYTPLEGRGQGIHAKIEQYAVQTYDHLDTVQAAHHLGYPDDSRDYQRIPIILADLKVQSIVLQTNNPRKVANLTAVGVQIEEAVPLVVPDLPERARTYLLTKQNWFSRYPHHPQTVFTSNEN